jgi:hypothetical protein
MNAKSGVQYTDYKKGPLRSPFSPRELTASHPTRQAPESGGFFCRRIHGVASTRMVILFWVSRKCHSGGIVVIAGLPMERIIQGVSLLSLAAWL